MTAKLVPLPPVDHPDADQDRARDRERRRMAEGIPSLFFDCKSTNGDRVSTPNDNRLAA